MYNDFSDQMVRAKILLVGGKIGEIFAFFVAKVKVK